MNTSYQSGLESVPLFRDIDRGEISSLFECLTPVRKKYKKDEIIYAAGDTVSYIGIVLSGFVRVVSEDVFGNRSIISGAGPKQMFAESFACARAEALPVSVVSATDSDILFLDYGRVLCRCSSLCTYHAKLIENMLSILAQKNIMLNRKLNIMSRRTIRAKLLAYLAEEVRRQGRCDITLDFDRQELADYLCVDRSALSAELSRLRDEGILDYNRSSFKLHCGAEDELL